MRVSFYTSNSLPVSMRGNEEPKQQKTPFSTSKTERDIKHFLEPFAENKKAKVPPLNLMRGINPNNNDVFDTFTRIDDVTREINFVKSQSSWDDCLLEEIEEFKVARREYLADRTQQNYDHMEEEMGDIFYTAASISKDSGIDPKEAFKTTNRKFFNRVNLMERMASAPETKYPEDLKDCLDYERRALWNAAKRKLYDAQSRQYQD